MQLLTSREAAERMHVTLKVLHRLRAEGRIGYVAITERKIAYQVEECDAWIARRERGEAEPASSNQIVPFSQRGRISDSRS